MDIPLDKILAANKILDKAAVPMEHRMVYDPEEDRILCSCGLRWYPGEELENGSQRH